MGSSRKSAHRPAGSPLFERANRKSGERGLCKSLRKEWRAAALAVGYDDLLFHDLRRTAVRIFERSIPDSSARALAGHTERFRTRYAIGAMGDFEFALPALDAYQRGSGWHFSGTAEKSSGNLQELLSGDGRSRTYDTADMRLPGRPLENKGNRGHTSLLLRWSTSETVRNRHLTDTKTDTKGARESAVP